MLSGGSHGETNEILASLIGHTASWLDAVLTQDVCYPNKKEVYSWQHNAIWLFRSQAIGGRPLLSKGTTQRERSSREQLSSSLIKKLFVR